MRHLHFFEPQLVDYRGHYFGYCAQVVRELRRRGIDVTVYGRRNCQVVCEGMRPEAVFSHDIFKEAARDSQVWAIENFLAVNQAFQADLARVNVERFSADDIVFFPTLTQNQLYALTLWLGRIPPARRPAVAVLLRYLTHRMDYNEARPNHEMIAHFYRYAAQSLRATQPRTVFCADTREMADAFKTIFGCDVMEVPVAMEPPAVEVPPARSLPARPLVAYPGHMSQLKGFHLLPEIIAQCSSQSPHPRFAIQVEDRTKRGFGEIVAWLERQGAPDVRLLQGSLSPEIYFRMMAEADVVLLPYSLAYYGHCSSGVFAEAAALGKVIVVPEGTVAARQGREYGLGVVAAEAWTAAGLSKAIGVAIRDWTKLQAAARDAAPRFRAEQSVEAFWTRVLEALPASVAAAA